MAGKIKFSILVFAILAPMLTAMCAFGQDTQATASVSSDTVGVQDQLQLTITVSGKDSTDAEPPRSLRPQNFRVVSGPSVGTQVQWINGRTSSSKSFGYILIPEREGQFAIDPIEIQAGGKTYKTQPIQIRVTSASAPRSTQPQRQTPFSPFDPFEDENPQARQSLGDAIIVRTELDRNSAYPGQQVTLSYKLYTQVQITGIQLQDNPSISGFWVEDIQIDKNPKATRQVINGREYQAFTIKKQALFANKTGRLQIPSSTFAISAEASGGFFGMFNRAETLYRKTQVLSLDVHPLPEEGRPAGFNNAVGSFSLSTDIDKKKVAAGEAVALRLKLEGRGNLKMISDIPLPSLPDFTIYSSKRSDTIRPFDQDQIGGDKTWEYVIVPKTPGSQTIPSLSLSYFNAEKNKYETVSTAPLTLDVVRGTDGTASISGLSGADKQEVTRRGTDISFIQLSPGEFETKDDPVYRKSWLYLVLAFPLLLNAGAFLYVRQKSRLNKNTSLVRSRNARKRALNNLKAAEKQGKLAPRDFYDLAASALSGYLADKFGLAEIELREDNLERALSGNSVPSEIIEEAKACLRECDFGRFVSAAQSSEKMQSLSARIQTNIDALEKASTSTRFGGVREPGITA
jgi:hypothetical protein